MNHSIFRSLAVMRAVAAPPPSIIPDAPVQPRRAPQSPATDAALLTILSTPIRDSEPAALGFARKEAELRAVFMELSVLEARALHSRLSYPVEGDPLAAAFLRLTADRRARLINFLAGARRRAAVGR